MLVRFKINTQLWTNQTYLTPLGPDGKPFPAGRVVRALVAGEAPDTVIDKRGRVWTGELLPAARFTVTNHGKGCEFTLPPDTDGAQASTLVSDKCQDSP